jgi:hypothetical protein
MKEDVHVRIDEDVMKAVRAYAEWRGISLAAAMSVLLRESLILTRELLKTKEQS